MTKTLVLINASSVLTGSASRTAADFIVSQQGADTVINRDLAQTSLPIIDEAWVNARLVPADEKSEDDKAILALSDTLVDELKTADTIVIGMPIYNFGMPASLKAWVDLVARPKVTFEYTSDGPRGLLEGKSAIVVYASGGVPMNSPVDFATPHMKTVLGFLGITDVRFVTAAEITTEAAITSIAA